MQLRILVAAVVALMFVVVTPAAARSPHRYSPKHGAKCRKGYRRVKHHGHPYCVKKRHRTAKLTAPEKVKLHAHLDPTYTRDPLDPFKVTYAYSASATQEAVAAARTSTDEPASLPSGVLALYSDGQLECAINVGSGVEGSECPVHYKALGDHRVTTIYTSGEQSATETEVEHISPLPSMTILQIAYIPLASPAEVGTSSGLFHVGDLSITLETSPPGLTAHLGCGDGSPEELTPFGCYQIEDPEQHVYAHVSGDCSAPIIDHFFISHNTTNSAIAGYGFPPATLENGTTYLRASYAGGNGYTASEAGTALQLHPNFTPQPDC